MPENALNLYKRLMMPRLLHTGVRQCQLRPFRSKLIGAAEGRVLEIGIGAGFNIPHYGRNVSQLIGVDPSPGLLKMAAAKTVWSHCSVKLLEGRCENLPLEAGSVDFAVMTWTLCSIADPIGALIDIKRVLRPGGSLLFIEHGLAPDDDLWVQRCQHRLTPLWKQIAGNCHLNRRVDQLLIASGLKAFQWEEGYLVPGPRLASYHYQGRAVIA